MVSNPVVLYRLSFYHIIIYHIQYVSEYRSSCSLVVGVAVCVSFVLAGLPRRLLVLVLDIYLMRPNLYTSSSRAAERTREYVCLMSYATTLEFIYVNGQQQKKNSIFICAFCSVVLVTHNILYYYAMVVREV